MSRPTRIAFAAGALALAATALAGRAAAGDELDLDLEQLVAEAVANHPDTQGARHAAAALHEVPSRAGSFPDPVAIVAGQNFRVDDLTLDGSPMTGLVFGLSQGIPFPGKLGRREKVAEAAAAVADERIGAIEVGVELRVRRLYWRLHFAEREQAIVAENTRVFDMLANVVHARYAVGQGAQQDALQAQVAHSRLRAHSQEAREATISLRRAVNGAVGRQPSATLARTRDPGPAPKLDRAALVARARRDNPVVQVARAGVALGLDAVAEARHDRYPDFQLSLGYRARAAAPGDLSEGADMISMSVAVSLPVWTGSKQSARVREERKRLSARRSAVDSVELEVVTELERVLDAYERLNEEIALYEKELLPETDQALDASIADYQVGGVEFVSVLDSWREDLQADLRYQKLLAERAERLAEIEALVGARLEKDDQ